MVLYYSAIVLEEIAEAYGYFISDVVILERKFVIFTNAKPQIPSGVPSLDYPAVTFLFPRANPSKIHVGLLLDILLKAPKVPWRIPP